MNSHNNRSWPIKDNNRKSIHVQNIAYSTEATYLRKAKQSSLPQHCGYNIGINHGFSCLNIRQIPREVLKTEAGGRGFQHLPRDLANVKALKNHVWSLLLRKTENVCYISRYFLNCFVSRFHRYLPNAISTDYARSGAGKYTSRNGSKSVVPVRS